MNHRTGKLTASEFEETSDRRAAFELADMNENAGVCDELPAFWVACNCGKDQCNCRESGTPYGWTILLVAIGAVAGAVIGALS